MAPGSEVGREIETLKVKVEFLQAGQLETRQLLRDHQEKIEEKFDSLEASIRPFGEALQRAKGFQGAVYLFLSLATFGLGALSNKILTWLLPGLKP